MSSDALSLLNEWKALMSSGSILEADKLLLKNHDLIRSHHLETLPNKQTSNLIDDAPSFIEEPKTVISGLELTGFWMVLIIAFVVPWFRAFSYNSWIYGYHMDDVIAIHKNADVIGNTSWYDFMRNDFWGLPMFIGEWTHK